MTEPTQEQIEAERERARLVLIELEFGGNRDREPAVIATALARRALDEQEEVDGVVGGFIRERERFIKAGRGTKTIIELRVLKRLDDAIRALRKGPK